MNHHIFEDLIFAEQPLTQQESAALKTHLQDCESCRVLADALNEVENQLHRSVMLEPAPGFAERWQMRLAVDDQRVQRKQSMLLLGFSIAGATLLLASLGVLLLPLADSPLVFVVAWLSRFAEMANIIVGTGDLVSSLFQAVQGSVSLIWVILGAGLVSLLAVLWLVSYRVLIAPRRGIK
jgi:predicted anti-sigma-YlaC factor YlaD